MRVKSKSALKRKRLTEISTYMHRRLFKICLSGTIENKSGSTVSTAFMKMIETHQCKLLQTDKGTEFLNEPFQKLLREKKIRHYTSENDDIKASVVERFNRTLKGVMWRYLTRASTGRYIDVLPQLVSSYNNTYHRSIKMTPSEVNAQNESIVRKRLYPVRNFTIRWKYNVGQSVRMKQTKRVFKKGYEPSWTEEIFTISSLYPSDPPTYILKDLAGEEIKGKFYEQEIQPVKPTDTYVVEKGLKTRRRGKRTIFRQVEKPSQQVQLLGRQLFAYKWLVHLVGDSVPARICVERYTTLKPLLCAL